MRHRRTGAEPDTRFALGVICCFGLGMAAWTAESLGALAGASRPVAMHHAYLRGIALVLSLLRAPSTSLLAYERIEEAIGMLALVLCVLALWFSTRRRRSAPQVERHASFARRQDLAVLTKAGAARNRILLGYLENEALYVEPRQSLLVIGPSQSGKTTGVAIPAILNWDGPVIATSVKGDLVAMTAEERRRRGAVSVFDPSGVAPVASSPWSPLGQSGTWKGARQMASGLCAVARSEASGLDDGGFWYATAEKLLAPLLFAAARAGLTMHDVVGWVDTGEVDAVLDILEGAGEPDALRAAEASFSREERQRSSVYTTAETIVAAFGEPSSNGAVTMIDPAELLSGGSDSLYLVAPAHEQQRLQPMFVALLKTVLDLAFEQATRQGGALKAPLLVVLDEAANVAPFSSLDALASTAASHGIQLLTVFQDVSQIEARYGKRAASVVNNHRAKLVCSGVGDPVTLEQVSLLVGEEEHASDQLSVERSGNWSKTESPRTRRLAPADWIRRLPPGHALVLYGHLAPFVVKLHRLTEATLATRWGRRRRATTGQVS